MQRKLFEEVMVAITYNGWVYEKVFYLEISKFILTFVKNFLIHLVINSFNMKMTKKDIKYIVKLFIAYPISLIFGIIGYRNGFDKMIIWLNKDA